MGALSDNFLKLRGTAEGSGWIEYRGTESNPFQIGARGDDGVFRAGIEIQPRGWVILNPNRTKRSSRLTMETKNSGNLGGAYWVWYADADSEIVGTNELSLWGYSRDSTGALSGEWGRFIRFYFALDPGFRKVINVLEDRLLVDRWGDNTGGALETSIAIRHNNTFKRVYVGAADSGGSGYRLLRVGN